jgi:hypothetical protein
MTMLKEDITPGYPSKEISYGGFTTKNLHHSPEATKAFENTIERLNKGLIKDGSNLLKALKATDAYMKLNDMHLQQHRAESPEEVAEWTKQHTIAKDSLIKMGEFLHHQDYWNAHQDELQLLQANAGLNNITGEMYMSNSHNQFQDLIYEASFVTDWKNKVKAIHGKDVKFEEEKKRDQYGVPQVHAVDRHSNRVGYIEKKSGRGFVFLQPFDKNELDEKTLTSAELKKREEIAKAMERDDPKMNTSKKMAIATAVAKRVAEETQIGESFNDDDWYIYDTKKKSVVRQLSPAPRGLGNKDDRDSHVPSHIKTTLAKDRKIHGDHLIADKGMRIKHLAESERSEFSANHGLASSSASAPKKYRLVHKKTNATRGVYSSKEDAHAALQLHPLRKDLTVESFEESVDTIEESFTVKDSEGKVVHVAYSEGEAKRKAAALALKTGKPHKVGYERAMSPKKTDESVDLQEMKQGKEYTQAQIMKKINSGEWEAVTDIKPGKHVELRHHTGKRVQVQVKEDFEQIEELNKSTLGSYAKKASAQAAGIATNAMHLKSVANMHRDASRGADNRGDSRSADDHAELANQYDDHSTNATNKQTKRQRGVAKAIDRLTKESVDEGHTVVWVDRNYKESKKVFKQGKLDSPDAAEKKAREHAKKLEKDPNIRSVRIKPMDESEQIEELSTDFLGKYKKAASADASNANQEGDFKKGDKRFSGIVKATKKQFANETKPKNEEVEVDESMVAREVGGRKFVSAEAALRLAKEIAAKRNEKASKDDLKAAHQKLTAQ